MIKKIFLGAAFMMLALGVAAQKQSMEKIAVLGTSDNRTMKHLETLTGRFGGRPIGSDAYDNARDWVAREFKSWGYDVALEKAGELSVGFNRDGWWGQLIGEKQMPLHFSTPSYTVGTNGRQRGHVVVEPRTTAEFNRMKGRLKGVWVLVAGKSVGYPLLHNDTIRERRHKIIAHNDSVASMRRDELAKSGKKIDRETPALFYDEMVDAGVLGFIQSSRVPITALYDKDVVKGNLDFDNLPAVPDIKLDENQYAEIRKLAEERREIELVFDIRNHFKLGPVPYHNVVATMKGSKHPDEYVILGAHLDSYDSATGAVDDGSGMSAMMEAARLIAESGAKLERTIVFIAFAGEEFGLLGSDAWVKQHKDKLANISNMFNRDGGPLPYVAFSAPASMVDEFKPVAELMHKAYPDFPFELKAVIPRKKPVRTGGNDASTFAVLGIPTLQMNEWTDPKGYDFRYGEIWHTDRDILNKSIAEYQEQAATALALIVLQTANASKLFPREDVFIKE